MAIRASKWISATTGRGLSAHTSSNASRQSSRGTAMRTTSQPAAASRSICAKFAAASSAGAFSMDCTTTGAPPPNGTARPAARNAALPTSTSRVFSFGFMALLSVRASSHVNRSIGCRPPAGPRRTTPTAGPFPLLTKGGVICQQITGRAAEGWDRCILRQYFHHTRNAAFLCPQFPQQGTPR